MTGSALLEVDATGTTSYVAALRSSNPLRLLAPVHRGPSVWAFTSSFGGGMVAGDHTALDLRLARGSRAFLGSQSSSKIYRNPDRPACRHTTMARVDDDALLVFAPDPIQPFAGSRFQQHQRFHLAPTAGLALVDALTAGRTARGERWSFSEFTSRNEVFVGPGIRFLDILSLRPEDGPLEAPFRMGEFNVLVLVLLLGPPARTAAESALGDVASRPIAHDAPALISASPIAGGAVVRIAARETSEALRLVRRFLHPLVPALGDDPWTRKW